ncbi:uncharacterized protein N7498_005205, partial [Penicillium cinerascens]
MTLSNPPGNHSNSPLSVLDGSDPLFQICWRRQTCSSCLTGDVPCSWCAISSTCVPNTSHLPILAPLRSSQICPLGAQERWEMRALPFGCNVSITTFLSILIAVLSTFALVGVVYVVVGVVKRVRGRWKEGHYERLEDQERQSSWRGCLGLGTVVSLLASFFGQSRGPTQGQSQDSVEDGHDDTESRPLL